MAEERTARSAEIAALKHDLDKALADLKMRWVFLSDALSTQQLTLFWAQYGVQNTSNESALTNCARDLPSELVE